VDEHGYNTVATAADSGVSGAVSPFKRPRLSPWLTDQKLMAQYDELVASNLDRFGRNARDLATLRDWAVDHGKRLTILSPTVALATGRG
jgi:DNA invertase Pin-like site-specific DNA recombinase